jgi:hypothetical protein
VSKSTPSAQSVPGPPPTAARSLPCATTPEEAAFVVRSGLTKTEAEDLLDWLEMRGCTERELSYHPVHGFVVRFRPPCSPKCPG